MLTPQEVSERAFQKATFNGYNMSQVEDVYKRQGTACSGRDSGDPAPHFYHLE